MKKLTQKKDGGSWFDDEIAALPDHTPEAELNSLAMQAELNKRPGVAVFVSGQNEKIKMQSVLVLWERYKMIHFPVRTVIDSSLKPGSVRVGYPS